MCFSDLPWQVLALAAVCVVVPSPLDVSNAGFVFTFGATAALLTVIPWTATWRVHWAARWLTVSVVSSLAVDAVLLPASAALLSRVSVAGPLLNLVAVPLMGVVQIAGMVTALPQPVDAVARVSGVVAHLAAMGIVESARLVDVWPRLSVRLPAPDPLVTVIYYAGLLVFAVGVRRSRLRRATWVGAIVAACAGTVIVAHVPVTVPPATGHLRLTALDVGQGDAVLLELPDGRAVLVDTGGSPFDGSGADIGRRVVEPALWARGLRRVDTLVVTHGDPDHVGGASAIVSDMTPRQVWFGVRVAARTAADRALDAARRWRVPVRHVTAGEAVRWGDVTVRVLNPPTPDWERRRVRNDDSVVLDVRYGDVALLLTGDISAEVKRSLIPRLGVASVRVLKIGRAHV